MVADPHFSYSLSMISGRQIRAGRALLGWSSVHLASEAGVSYATVSRCEQSQGVPSVRATILAQIQGAMERGGIIFLDAGDTRAGGDGVRLRE